MIDALDHILARNAGNERVTDAVRVIREVLAAQDAERSARYPMWSCRTTLTSVTTGREVRREPIASSSLGGDL